MKKLVQLQLTSLFIFFTYFSAISQTATAPSSGNGDRTNPYKIESLDNLYWLSLNSSSMTGKYIIQTKDIDATATATWFPDGSGGYYGFNPIGVEFKGHYDGQGHRISNVYMNRGGVGQSLFRYINEGSLKNLFYENPTSINDGVGSPNGSSYGSALVVSMVRSSTISNVHLINGTYTITGGTGGGRGAFASKAILSTFMDCSSDATFTINTTNQNAYGNFIAYSWGNNNYYRCSASGTINGGTAKRIGGFVGQMEGPDVYKDCHSSVNVTGAYIIGSFAGMTYSTTQFNNCFATGDATGTEYIGGFLGWEFPSSTAATITNCYSTGVVSGTARLGGFCGEPNGTVTYSGCFWDTQTSTQGLGANGSTPTGITGQTTANMTTQSTYTSAGWDFMGETTNGTVDNWYILGTANNGYPSLKQKIRYWTGAIDNDITNAGNWQDDILPVDTSIIFIDESVITPLSLGQNFICDKICFNNSSSKITLNSKNLSCNQVLGANANNYIETNGTGVLKINIADDDRAEFPIGVTDFTPMSISNSTGSADTFYTQMEDNIFDDGNSPATFPNNYIDKTWHINKNNANAGSGIDMEFEWNGANVTGTISTAAMGHFNGSSWEFPSGTTTSNGNSMKYEGYTGSFSPFIVVDQSLVLPIELGKFELSLSNSNTINLYWTTLSEQNNSHFFIERSENGSNWEQIGRVEGIGNSSELITYNFEDLNPNRVNYYRLKQVDFDDKFEYSNILSLKINNNSIQVFPNPVKDRIRIISNSNLDEIKTIELFNSNGQKLLHLNNYNSENLESIDITNFPNGLYFLSIYSKFGNKTIKFSKE